MNDRLITIAIYTYEKAQIVKGVLENEGITATIQNVNLIQPVISAGVRVRIMESDLPQALRVLEQYPSLTSDTSSNKEEGDEPKRVLIPIDFSDYSLTACKIGFDFAHSLGAEVMLLHVYFSPYFPNTIPITDTFSYDVAEAEAIKKMQENVMSEMAEFMRSVADAIERGEMAKVEYTYTIREGIPEDEISSFSRQYKPKLVVMGTRGKDQKEIDLIGSVTAEVIDSAACPVFATPDSIAFDTNNGENRVAFFTNFDQHDLIVLDTFMRLFGSFPFKINFVHLSTKPDAWNEVQLAGVKEYFGRHYPDRESVYTILNSNALLDDLDRFIRESGITVLALPSRKRNIFARLFNPSIAHKMLFHTDTPLLVIPS